METPKPGGYQSQRGDAKEKNGLSKQNRAGGGGKMEDSLVELS